MSHGELVGMLTFREVIQAVVRNGGALGTTAVRTVMDDFRSPVRRKPNSTRCAESCWRATRATCR